MRSRVFVSIREVELLYPYIDALEQLDEGKRLPETPAQEHFIAVCRGKFPAESDFEKAYIRWRVTKPDLRSLLIRAEEAQRRQAAEKATTKAVSEPQQYPEEKIRVKRGLPPLDSAEELIQREKDRQKRVEEKRALEPKKGKFKPRKIVESWGNRDAWKKDSARNKYNGR